MPSFGLHDSADPKRDQRTLFKQAHRMQEASPPPPNSPALPGASEPSGPDQIASLLDPRQTYRARSYSMSDVFANLGGGAQASSTLGGAGPPGWPPGPKHKCETFLCNNKAEFGWEQEAGRFCADHKGDGMTHVQTAGCQHPQCTRGAAYGTTRGEPRHCFSHKQDGERHVSVPTNAIFTKGPCRPESNSCAFGTDDIYPQNGVGGTVPRFARHASTSCLRRFGSTPMDEKTQVPPVVRSAAHEFLQRRPDLGGEACVRRGIEDAVRKMEVKEGPFH